MKRLGFLIVVVTALLPAAHVCPADEAYELTMVGHNQADAAQLKTMIDDMLKVAAKNGLFHVNINLISNQEEFMEKLRAGKLQLFMNNNLDYVWELLDDKNYSPFARTSWFGDDNNALCMYVSKKNPAAEVKDLAGKRAVTYDRALAYYVLREMAGAPPEDFFQTLTPNQSGISMAYSISLDEADVALFERFTEKLMEFTNPGALRSLRRVSCIEMPYPPLFRAKDVSTDIEEKFMSFLRSYKNYPELQKYKPLEKRFRVKLVPVKPGEYKGVVELYRRATKSEWDSDYKRWKKMSAAVKESQ